MRQHNSHGPLINEMRQHDFELENKPSRISLLAEWHFFCDGIRNEIHFKCWIELSFGNGMAE